MNESLTPEWPSPSPRTLNAGSQTLTLTLALAGEWINQKRFRGRGAERWSTVAQAGLEQHRALAAGAFQGFFPPAVTLQPHTCLGRQVAGAPRVPSGEFLALLNLK